MNTVTKSEKSQTIQTSPPNHSHVKIKSKLAPTYLRVIHVAERYNTSENTIWRWTREGHFPKPIKLGARVTAWSIESLEKWEQTKI